MRGQMQCNPAFKTLQRGLALGSGQTLQQQYLKVSSALLWPVAALRLPAASGYGLCTDEAKCGGTGLDLGQQWDMAKMSDVKLKDVGRNLM